MPKLNISKNLIKSPVKKTFGGLSASTTRDQNKLITITTAQTAHINLAEVAGGTVAVAGNITIPENYVITLKGGTYSQEGRYTLFTYGGSFTGLKNLKLIAPNGLFVSRLDLDTTNRKLTVDLYAVV